MRGRLFDLLVLSVQVRREASASAPTRAMAPLRASDPPQARAPIPPIHPTIPARFPVTRCPLSSSQDPSSPLGAFSRTPSLPHAVHSCLCPRRGDRPPPGATLIPTTPHTQRLRLVTAGASPPLRVLSFSFPAGTVRPSRRRRRNGADDVMTSPPSQSLAARMR